MASHENTPNMASNLAFHLDHQEMSGKVAEFLSCVGMFTRCAGRGEPEKRGSSQKNSLSTERI